MTSLICYLDAVFCEMASKKSLNAMLKLLEESSVLDIGQLKKLIISFETGGTYKFSFCLKVMKKV